MIQRKRRAILFQRIGVIILSCLALGSVSGCQTAALPPVEKGASTNAAVAEASSPPKRVFHVPKLKPTTAQKLNPLFWFSNMDDPVPPKWYRPDNRCRTVLWHFRNPLHNLFFYVLGIADKEFEIVGRFPGRIGNPDGGWNWTVCKYKCLRLPFISYSRGKFSFYLGWRNRGNLGMKFNYSNR